MLYFEACDERIHKIEEVEMILEVLLEKHVVVCDIKHIWGCV